MDSLVRQRTVVRGRVVQVARWWMALAMAAPVLSPRWSSAQESPLPATACPAPPSPGSGVLTGWTRDRSSGVRLGFATVALRNVLTGDSLQVRVNLRGEFAFCSVPAGSWRADARLGELRAAAPVEIAAGEPASLILDLATPQVAGRSGRLSGRVLDAETGSPVAHAAVELVGTQRGTLTGSDGAFSFPFLEPGDVAFRVTMLGYADAEGRVPVAAGQIVEVEVKLTTRVIALEPITVTLVRQQLLLPDMAALDERVRSGWGQFVLEDEIQMRAPRLVTDLLDRRGVDVTDDGRRIIMRRTMCPPEVYIDDVKVTGHQSRSPTAGSTADAQREAAEAVNSLAPRSIHAIEVYRGPSETPAKYLGTNAACGVILIWTRR